MKNLISICVVAIATFSVLSVNAQKTKSFAGTVKFHIKYEGKVDPRVHVPQDIVVSIFGNKTKQTVDWQHVITNGDAVTETYLFDIPGSRAGFVKSQEMIEDEQSAYKYTYKKADETKTICGYVCTRYDGIKYDVEEDEETKYLFYTTTEIGESSDINSVEYPGLSGYPLYVETEVKGLKVIMEATEVKAAKVKSVDFLIPSDYKMLTGPEWNAYIKVLQGGSEE